MPHQKTRVLVLFGGRSPEHDVSVVTGLQVLEALDPDLYEAIPLYIAPNGRWVTGEALRDKRFYVPSAAELEEVETVVPILGDGTPRLLTQPKGFFKRSRVIPFDVALPAFHGLIGEDGPIQGLFESANVPYTGMRLMASSILMNKIATKRMMQGSGVPLLPFHEIRRPTQGLMLTKHEIEAVAGNVSFPCCLKPANLGSSIGVSRVTDFQEVAEVLPGLFRFDMVAMLEPFVENLVEYNVAVTRINGEVLTSAIERPKCSSELLDFKTKYLSGGGSKSGKLGGTKNPSKGSEGMLSLTRDINPDLPADFDRNIRTWAAEVFNHVEGSGVPRLDFLCNQKTGETWFNEANPCPGSFGYFLWEAASQPILFTELLDGLLSEAMKFHDAKQIPLDPTPVDARLFVRH